MARGRPKKTKAVSVDSPATVMDTAEVDKILDAAKGRFQVVATIGLLPDRNIDVVTSNNNYAILQWLLERAKYELLLHEKQSYMKQELTEKGA